MPSLAAQTISITIDRPFEQAYAFAREPENFPKWAAGMSSSLHREGDIWVADAPQGRATVRFSEPNDYGVLDHWVLLDGKPEITIPLRMIANGDGTEVMLTLFTQPDMDEADVARDAAMVRKDLATLKALLEG
ncbi:MAG: SRPBCC family protein [Sphingobium sp.]